MSIAVALDGPVGAGKSTIAKECAKRLGFVYIDTGAMYRSIGLYCVNNGVDINDDNAVAAALADITLKIKPDKEGQHVILCGNDVTDKIRTPEISMAASRVSAVPKVREFLLELQRSFARTQNVIMDGRDIGTVVLPDAKVKIFLTASDEIRAKRRYDELVAKGEQVSYEDVLKDLRKRDYDDSHRSAAPLKQAEDAVLADTSELDFDGSCALIENIIRSKAGAL